MLLNDRGLSIRDTTRETKFSKRNWSRNLIFIKNYYFLLHFYCIRKDIFVLKTFNFCVEVWSYRKNKLIKKMIWFPKLCRVNNQLQSTFYQISHDVTVIFCQLIKHSQITIFLQNLCRKWGKETSYRPCFICYMTYYYMT